MPCSGHDVRCDRASERHPSAGGGLLESGCPGANESVDSLPVSMMFPPEVRRSTMAVQSRESVKVPVESDRVRGQASALSAETNPRPGGRGDVVVHKQDLD